MEDVELHALLKRMISGDQIAFESIYEQTHNVVYRTIAMLVYNKHDVEDIMNEVYMQMWKSLDNYDLNRSFYSWLHGITIRQIQTFKRKNWRIFRIFEKECSTRSDSFEDNSVFQIESDDELFSNVKMLSDKLRIVVILRYYNDYSLEEISQILEIPLGTVKSRLNSAMKSLRKIIEISSMA